MGRRPVRRQSRLGEAPGRAAGDALRRGAGVPRWAGRGALPHARRLAHHLGAARPAARGLGLSQDAQVLRHDHSEVPMAGSAFPPMPIRRSFASSRRARSPARSPPWCRIRSGRASSCTSSAPRRSRSTGCRGWPTRSEIPCFGLTSPEAGSDAASMIEFRRGLPRHLARPRGPRHQAQLAQALHHARADRDRDRACLQALRSRSPDRRPRRDRHHRRAGADEPARCRDRPPPSASVHVLPERSRPPAATSSFRSTTSSAASRRSERAGRC